jgi:hypothetical protein
MQCALKPYAFKNDQTWGLGDELVISSDRETITIVNDHGFVTTMSSAGKRENRRITITSDKYLSSIDIPAGSQIINVRAYDLTGQMVKSDLTGDVIRLGQTGSRVVTLQMRLTGGKLITLRSILTGN